MEFEGLFPRLQVATACPYPEQRITSSPRPSEMFRDTISLYGEELLALRPTLKLEDHPLSRVLYWLFAAARHIWRQFIQPRTQDAPCCGNRDRLSSLENLQ